jgi:DNA-binding transcriptional regulator LsrR (DeoR family)
VTEELAGQGPSTDALQIGSDDLRLMTKVARMYHERGMRQPEIAEQLNISQPRVSRLLKRAAAVGVVRTTVVTPRGVYAQLEELIERRYGLKEVVVADTADLVDEQALMAPLGSTAAQYLETTLMGGDRIGISSWSASLLATVDAMVPRTGRQAEEVVQVLGGLGVVTAQAQATRLTGRLAQLTGAKAAFLPAPGLVGSPDTREVLESDPNIASVLQTADSLTVLLAGVGSLQPSPLLRESGNAIAPEDEEQLRRLGAVGDVCMRFFDEDGVHIPGDLDRRVVGIGVDALRRVPRRVGVAGGERKYTAIRAALRGGWINVLITDLNVAQRLADDPA